MKRITIFLVFIGIALMTYSCAVTCGPGPAQSTGPVTYPSGYTLDKQDEKAPSK